MSDHDKKRTKQRTCSGSSLSMCSERKIVKNFTKKYLQKSADIQKLYRDYANFQDQVHNPGQQSKHPHQQRSSKTSESASASRSSSRLSSVSRKSSSPTECDSRSHAKATEDLPPSDQALQKNARLKSSLAALRLQIEAQQKAHAQLRERTKEIVTKATASSIDVVSIQHRVTKIKEHMTAFNGYIDDRVDVATSFKNQSDNIKYYLIEEAFCHLFPIGVKILCQQPHTQNSQSNSIGGGNDSSKEGGGVLLPGKLDPVDDPFNHSTFNHSTPHFQITEHQATTANPSNLPLTINPEVTSSNEFRSSFSNHTSVHEIHIDNQENIPKSDLLHDAMAQRHNVRTNHWQRTATGKTTRAKRGGPINAGSRHHVLNTRSRSNSSERSLNLAADNRVPSKNSSVEKATKVASGQQDRNRHTYIVHSESCYFNDWIMDLHLFLGSWKF